MDEVFTRTLDASPTDSVAELDARYLVTEVLGGNPRRSIVAHRLLTNDYLPWFLQRSVHRGRQDGMTWTGISRLMGITRQAVQKRFDHAPTLADLLLPVLPRKRQGTSREHQDLLDDIRQRRELRDAEQHDAVVAWRGRRSERGVGPLLRTRRSPERNLGDVPSNPS